MNTRQNTKEYIKGNYFLFIVLNKSSHLSLFSVRRPQYFNSHTTSLLTCDQAFFFFAAEGGRKKKESLIQLLVESSAAPQLKCLSTRVSAMPSDKSEPITIYRKSLRWRESAEARSGHEVCKHLCKLPFVSRPIRKKSRFWTFYRRLDK